MISHRLAIAFSLYAIVLMAFPATALSQGPFAEDGTHRETHFKYQTSIGLGIRGTQVSSRGLLVDENQFQYDTLSLIGNPEVKITLELSDDQMREILDIREDVVKVLDAVPLRKKLSEDHSEMELVFRDGEERIQEIFTESQRSLLNQVKHIQGVKQVGFAKYFSSSHFDGAELSDDEMDRLESLDKGLAKLQSEAARDLLEQANIRLLSELSDDQMAIFRQTLGEEFESKFLKQKMFLDLVRSNSKRPGRRRVDPVRFAKLKKSQRELKLSPEQIQEVKQLNRNDYESLSQLLDSDQLKKLNQMLVMSDLRKYGTVRTICCGWIVSLLSLTEDEVVSLHDTGREIFYDLREDMLEMRQQVLREQLEGSSTRLQNRILGAMGRGE